MYGKSFPFVNDLDPIFIKDRAHDNKQGTIGDDAAQYEHDVNVTIEEDVGLSQMAIDDFFMTTQEPNESPSLMASASSASKTSTHQKRKGHARNLAMEQMSENFQSFVDMVGPKFKH